MVTSRTNSSVPQNVRVGLEKGAAVGLLGGESKAWRDQGRKVEKAIPPCGQESRGEGTWCPKCQHVYYLWATSHSTASDLRPLNRDGEDWISCYRKGRKRNLPHPRRKLKWQQELALSHDSYLNFLI